MEFNMEGAEATICAAMGLPIPEVHTDVEQAEGELTEEQRNTQIVTAAFGL